MRDHEAFPVESLKCPLHVESQLGQTEPSTHLLSPLHLLNLLHVHDLLDRAQDFPLVQLEKAILFVKLLLFSLEHRSDLVEQLSTMLAHLNLDFFFGAIDACRLSIYLLQVHLLLILLHELFEDLIILFFELLHVELFLASVVLL